MKKEIETKPQKPPLQNDKNFVPPPPKHQTFKSEASRVELKPQPPSEVYNYKFNTHMPTENSYHQSSPYLPKNFNLLQAEE
jgi:hypothetical protein